MLLNILNALIFFATIAVLVWAVIINHQINKILKEIHSESEKFTVNFSDEKKNELDDNVANAERLYLEGIHSILSYDVETMKKHLKGVDDA